VTVILLISEIKKKPPINGIDSYTKHSPLRAVDEWGYLSFQIKDNFGTGKIRGCSKDFAILSDQIEILLDFAPSHTQ
jgi:hypothetical protein